MVVPPCHKAFIDPQATSEPDDLFLRIRNEPMPSSSSWQTPLCLSDVWELWLDEAGRYVFVAPTQSPPRCVVVNQNFKSGEVLGDFSASEDVGRFPLLGIGIMLFVNWLAEGGDIILHAAGVEVDGQGYCFVGSKGTGKSTLAASLSANPKVKVLGEDQVIVRWQDGSFWVYGTPWHVNPALCSPHGVPLKKVFFLDRDAKYTLGALTPIEGITRLLQTAFIPYYRPAVLPAILERLEPLSEQAPFFCLAYRLGSDILSTLLTA